MCPTILKDLRDSCVLDLILDSRPKPSSTATTYNQSPHMNVVTLDPNEEYLEFSHVLTNEGLVVGRCLTPTSISYIDEFMIRGQGSIPLVDFLAIVRAMEEMFVAMAQQNTMYTQQQPVMRVSEDLSSDGLPIGIEGDLCHIYAYWRG
ncbi:hypothetical protein CR513_38334, partial [Mucuna pruriens]